MKKQFVDPKMTKCEQPLDKVTMTLGGYGCDKRTRRPIVKLDGPFNDS